MAGPAIREAFPVLVVGAVFAAAYLPLARLGVDPHHDGLMLKPALVVAEGGMIHRDVFSQYGPMATWVHALWVLLLGPTLWAIRTGTAVMLVAAASFFFVAWRRVFDTSVALVAVSCAFLLTPHFSPEISANPWSADVAFFLLSVLTLVLTSKRTAPLGVAACSFASGALVGMILLTRLNLGVSLAVVLGLWELLHRRIRSLGVLVLGFTLVVGSAAMVLGLGGALDEWWLQSVESPRSWLSNVVGESGGLYIRHQVFTLALPSAAIALLMVAGFGGGLERMLGTRNPVLVRTTFAIVYAVLFVVYRVGWSLPGWNRWDASWVVILVVVAAFPFVLGRRGSAQGGADGSEESGGFSSRSEGLWLIALAALVQIYPVAGPRYLWWATVPALGPVVHLLRRLTLPGWRRVLVGLLAVATLVPIAVQQAWRNAHAERVSMPGVPVLDRMLMDSEIATALAFNLDAAQAYIEREGQPPVLNLCADGLYSTLTSDHAAADPYFVFWSFPEGAIDDEVRGEFINEHRPLMWWCPPAPDPKILASGYGMRLLPVDPEIRDDPAYEAWPLTGRIGVPLEWDPLPGELPLSPAGYDEMLYQLVDEALRRGFFEGLAPGSTVVLEGRERISDANGFILRHLERDANLRFVEAMPDSPEVCAGEALCDGEGSRIAVVSAIPVEEHHVLVLSPSLVRLPGGEIGVAVEDVRLFGRADVTAVCDLPATVEKPLQGLDGALGWALRHCSGAVDTSLDDFESWVATGCEGRPGWWRCAPPVADELAVLAEGALSAGLFEGIGARSTVVLGAFGEWRHGSGLYLDDRMEVAGIRFARELPADAVACGEAAWCDVEGRRLYVLDVVDRPGGPVLVLAAVGDVDTVNRQIVVALGHVRLAGPANRTPPCDLSNGIAEVAPSNSSATVVRQCSGPPATLTVFESWVAEGCDGRSGWWLCH